MEKNIKQKFLFLLFSSLIFLFSFGGNNIDFFSMILMGLSFNVNLIILLAVLIFNSLHIIKDVNNNYLYLCRVDSIDTYYKMLGSSVFKSNTKFIVIYLLLIISVSAIGCLGNYSVPMNPFYDFSFLIILFYYLLKFIIICSLLSSLTVYVYSFFKKVGVIFYYSLLTMFSLTSLMKEDVIVTGISNYPLNYIEIMSFLQYGSFWHDILAFLLFLCILIAIKILLMNLLKKYRMDID